MHPLPLPLRQARLLNKARHDRQSSTGHVLFQVNQLRPLMLCEDALYNMTVFTMLSY